MSGKPAPRRIRPDGLKADGTDVVPGVRRTRLRERGAWTFAGAVFVVATGIGIALMRMIASGGPRMTNLPLHVELLLASRATGAQPGYSIYYPLLSAASLGSDDPAVVLSVATVLLG
ncbi:hypothetical protein [Enemella sp. A6]|uniref:hypothetical protein n=1 Tax=Enemella sp. A6 TaxID=3440152 RepID=UPI003EC07C67